MAPDAWLIGADPSSVHHPSLPFSNPAGLREDHHPGRLCLSRRAWPELGWRQGRCLGPGPRTRVSSRTQLLPAHRAFRPLERFLFSQFSVGKLSGNLTEQSEEWYIKPLDSSVVICICIPSLPVPATPKFWSVCLLKARSHTAATPQRERRQWPPAPPVPRQSSYGSGVTSQGASVALLFRLESQPRSGSVWLLMSFSLLAALLRQSTPTCTRETLSRPQSSAALVQSLWDNRARKPLGQEAQGVRGVQWGEAASQERELRFWSSSAHKRQQAWVSVSL